MPISEDEAERLINHIEETVRSFASDPGMRGVIGLVDQWKADVEAGRPIERRLSVRRSSGPVQDDLFDVPPSPSTTSGDFIGKEDYTNVEQLDMLVNSLGLAFLVPPMMSKRLLDTITKYSEEQNQEERPDLVVRFLGATTTDVSRISPPVSRETIAQSYASTEELAALLNEIVQEAELTPRRFMDDEDIS